MVNVSSGKKNEIIGTTAGLAIGTAPIAYITYDALSPLKPAKISVLQSMMQQIMPPVDTFDKTKAVAETIIKNEGLAEKGIKLFVADNTPKSNQALDELLKNEKPKFLVEKVKTTLKKGCNAFFHPKSKHVCINNEIAHSSVFHELGHAKHFVSKNPLMKLLTQARNIAPFGVSLAAPIFLGVAMFHKVDNKKPKQEKGKIERTLDFVANNAGKLTLASYAPMVLEEGLASVDGIKMAKKYLTPDKISVLKGSYLKAFGTYAQVALGVSALIGLASIVKNKIANKSHA